MTSDQIALAYFVATLAMLGLGMGGGTNRPVAGAAVLVGLIYALGAMGHWVGRLYGLPEVTGFLAYPILDTVGALTAHALYRAGGGRWAWWLSLAFWLQIGLAAAFGLAAWMRFGDAIFHRPYPEQFAALFYAYKSMNNGVYIVELLLIGGVGGRHVLDRLRNWLVDLRGRHFVHVRGAGDPSPSSGSQ